MRCFNLLSMSKLRELTIDETAIFVNIHGASKNQASELFNEICNEGGWVLKAIKKRFEAHDLKVDEKTMILILSIGDGVVGRCANYVDDIAVICQEKSITALSFDDFTKKIYPWGVPCF